jgi:hypothetical protein
MTESESICGRTRTRPEDMTILSTHLFMNPNPFRKLVYLAAVIVSGSILISARANDDSYWTSVLEKAKIIYAVKNDHATLMTEEHLKEGDQIRLEVIQRLKDDPSFAQQVRKSLRNDARVWVRAFSAGVLIKAFEQAGTADEIYILSDPDIDVRGFGGLSIRVYKIQDAACSLPAGLLSKLPGERFSAILGIREMLGWKGLPYYAELLYDTDADVASAAAKSFQTCKREDAVPHLLRYLRKYGRTRSKKAVTKIVIDSLCTLHGEPVLENVDLRQAVDEWIKRLEKASTDNNSPK